MTTHYRTKGFVFKKEELGEADRIFSIFTNDFGKLEIRAKAIRKINSKLRAGIDNFFLSEVEFIQGKNYKTLTDATALTKPKMTLAKLEFLNKISGLLDNFVKGQEKDEKIFNLINETLNRTNSQLIYYYFFWNFFSELGYMPEIYRCTKCSGKLIPYGLYFSNKEGGVVCKRCASFDKKDQKINSDVVKILRLILEKNWQILNCLRIEAPAQSLLNQLSENYCSYMLSSHSFV